MLDIADDRKAAKAARNDPPRTAGELDAAQKGGGFVNTMAELSPAEKRLYDDLVAQGNWKAVEGLNLVALSRVGMTGREVTTPDGQSFFPSAQEVTADSLRSLFRHLIVDADGHAGGAFEALASYLDKKPVA